MIIFYIRKIIDSITSIVRVKIRSIWETSESSNSFYPQGGAEKCAWSNDGHLLTISGKSNLSVYLMNLTPLCSAHNTRAFLLTNLTEGTLYQCVPVDDSSIVDSKGGSFLSFVLELECEYIIFFLNRKSR